MSRPEPKFSVGETVILYCPEYPGVHGRECVITDRDWFDQKDGCWGYKVLQGDEYLPGIYTGRPAQYAAEFRLRKKHRPADQSYTELLNTLKQTNKEKA